ncbi:hypothetical protein Tco_0414090 [Tanacetum coccineum]
MAKPYSLMNGILPSNNIILPISLSKELKVHGKLLKPIFLMKPQSDQGKARHSVSSTFAHHNRRSSSHQEDDDEDDAASRASTLSPTTYLNSLKPFDYQQYDAPTSSEQNDDLLFGRQTDLLN